jgi:hypothetical protein
MAKIIEKIVMEIPLSCAFLKNEARNTENEVSAKPPRIMKTMMIAAEVAVKRPTRRRMPEASQPGKYMIEKVR